MLKWLKARMSGRGHRIPGRGAVDSGRHAGRACRPPDYLRREPLLNREHQVCGYELNLERPQLQRVRHPAAQRFLDGALLDRLGGAKFAGVIGRRMGFLPLHPVSLDLPKLDRLAVVAATAATTWSSACRVTLSGRKRRRGPPPSPDSIRTMPSQAQA